RRHTRFSRDWSSDVCSSDLLLAQPAGIGGYIGPVRALGQRLGFGGLKYRAAAALLQKGQPVVSVQAHCVWVIGPQAQLQPLINGGAQCAALFACGHLLQPGERLLQTPAALPAPVSPDGCRCAQPQYDDSQQPPAGSRRKGTDRRRQHNIVQWQLHQTTSGRLTAAPSPRPARSTGKGSGSAVESASNGI